MTDDERVVLEPDRREVHHPYSDRPAAGIRVATYSLEEIFAEKVRALVERLRPRDLFDVVHLYWKRALEPNRAAVVVTLTEKCEFKRIPVPTLESILNSIFVDELRTAWEQMLGHQLPALPSFESFWKELPDVFGWLFEEEPRIELPTLTVAAAGPLDLEWRPPAMATSWRPFGSSAPLEVIRFAAANRLCIELDYRDEHGRQSTRTIEPYSFRRSGSGNVLLFAVKTDTGESRSYRVDRIVDAAVTRQSFSPRFDVELRDTGPVATPTVVARRRGRALVARQGSTQTFRCTLCGKTFRRTSFDSSLNPHKDRNGGPCHGRVGILVKPEY